MRRLVALGAAIALTLALVVPGTATAGGGNPGQFISVASIDFAPGYWSPGVHEYWVRYDATECGCAPDTYGPFYFTVDPQASGYRGNVMLTNQEFWGALWSYSGPVADNAIKPVQGTFFYAGWDFDFTGASYTPPDTMQTAKAWVAGSTISFSWDGGPWVVASQGPVLNINIAGFGVPNNPATGWFMRSHGTKY